MNGYETGRSTDAAWLTPDEAVRYLALTSRKALYQAVRRGALPAHRLGRLLRFYRPELDRVLLGRSTSAVA